jgi:dolichol kinase
MGAMNIMMTTAVFVAMLAVLLFAEYLTLKKNLHSELSRKFVHVTVGTFAAFWPFFLSWGQIQLLSVVALVGMIASLKFNLFKSMHNVTRTTYGEILSVAAVGILAFLVDDPWVFAAAMLHLSLADGLAAVAGLAYGQGNGYKVLGLAKSVAGTVVFFTISVVIMIGYLLFSGNQPQLATMLLLPLAATVAENLSGRGTDNLVSPLLVALVLTSPLA